MLRALVCISVVIFPLTAFAAPDCNVRDAQNALANAGFEPGDIDGLWGRSTGKAVEAFQEQNDLVRTSELDHATCSALLRPMTEETVLGPNEEIRKLQEALLHFGLYFEQPNGKPGQSTSEALRSLKRVTGKETLPEGQDLLSFIESHSALREARMDEWIALLDREIMGDEEIERIHENRNNPSDFRARMTFIPTQLPSHIAYRDEKGEFRIEWEREVLPELPNQEPSVFAGTAPFEFLGVFVNLSDPGDPCKLDKAFGGVMSKVFRYLGMREKAGLPQQAYYTLLASSSHTKHGDDPELWCLEHARWGLRFAEPGYNMPEQAASRLTALDTKLAAAAAAEKEAAVMQSLRARMAAIDDPNTLDNLLKRAIEDRNVVAASAALEALEILLAKRGAQASESDKCHRSVAAFSPYVPKTRNIEMDFPIFATIQAMETDRRTAYLTKSEHLHDVPGYIRPALLDGFFVFGKGETISFLPDAGLIIEEPLEPHTIIGPIFQGAVIRVDGELTLGHDSGPVLEFRGSGDKWHRLTFLATAKSGLTYLRGEGSVSVDGATITFDETNCGEIGATTEIEE